MKNFQILIFIIFPYFLFSQNTLILPSGIYPGANIPKLTNSAIRQLNSGSLGDLVFDLTFQQLRFYNGSQWEFVNGSENPIATINSLLSTDNASGTGIFTDSENGIYFTGNFNDSLILGQDTIQKQGLFNSFITKFSENKQVVWNGVISSTEGLNTKGIIIDSLDNIYVYGTFSGILTFKSFSSTSSGGEDIFILKLNKNGILKFGRRFGGVSDNVISNMKLSASQSIYFCGNFRGSMAFAGSNRTSSGGKDGFIAEMDSLGNQIKFNKIGGSNDEEIVDFDFSTNNNLVLGGNFQSSLTIGSSLLNPVVGVLDNLFLATLDVQSNNWQWAIKLNISGNNSGIKGISKGTNGAVYVAGYYSGNFVYDSGSLGSTSPSTFAAGFLFQTTSVLVINWVQKFVGNAAEIGEKVYCENNGDVTFLLNGVSNSINTNYMVIPKKGLNDGFIFKFSSFGNLLYKKDFASVNQEFITNVFIDKKNRTFVIGSFTNKLKIDNNSISSLNRKQNVFWGFFD